MLLRGDEMIHYLVKQTNKQTKKKAIYIMHEENRF